MAKGPAILSSSQPTKSAPFRARDVRANIKELGFEKGIEMSLTLMADEQVGMRQTVMELASTCDKLIDLVSQMTVVNGEMALTIKELKRKEDQFDASRGSGIS